MARYIYTARDAGGKKIQGLVEAASDISVISKLRKQNLFPIEVDIADSRETGLSPSRKQAKKSAGRAKLKEISVFTRQAAVMLEAGISISDLLADLSEQTANRYFAEVLKTIKQDIREGANFSEAISKYPKIFSPLYVALVKAGEESGSLSEVLTKLSEDMENQIALISKLKQALSYPALVSSFFLSVVAFVFLFLLPQFQTVFTDFNADMPAFTTAVMNISSFFVSAMPVILVLTLIAIAGFLSVRNKPKGRRTIDGFKLRMPIFGGLVLKVSLSRLAGSFSTLIAGGITVTTALAIVSKTAGNAVIEETIQRVREGVIQGSLVGEEMKKHRIFPIMFVRMVTVGENTGKMDEMLNRVAKFFRDEVDATLNTLASVIEPVLIISLGAVVGVVVLAIYLPIFSIAGTMR